jgi:hypothetical protein
MSANDIAACFIGTFLGLVAAALLIAVLGSAMEEIKIRT